MIADLIIMFIPLMCQQWESTFNFLPDPDNPGKSIVDMNAGLGLIWGFLIFMAYFIQYMARQHSEKFIVSVKFRLEQGIKNKLFQKLLNADYISISNSDPN